MSHQLSYASVDANTRIETSLCETTHMARAVVQVRQGKGWINTGIAGVGHGAQDAANDLFAAIARISETAAGLRRPGSERAA